MPQPKSSGRPKPRADQEKSTESSRSRATSKSTKRPPKKVAAKAAAAPAKPAKPKRTVRPTRSATPPSARVQRAKPGAGSAPRGASSSADDAFGAALMAIRDRLARGIMFTGDRLQETLDDAASRGRLTHKDAEDLAQRLISAGRKQTEDLLVELEQIVERGGDELLRASRKVRDKLR
jgi:hypothetical protein